MEKQGTTVDSTLRALNWLGPYQILHIVVVLIGSLGAAYQLFGNIFIGRHVTWHQCSAPGNDSSIPSELENIDWNSSQVEYGKCEITVFKNNLSDDSTQYPCLFGYDYAFSRELSFRTEDFARAKETCVGCCRKLYYFMEQTDRCGLFDLVCDWKLLGGLAQTFVIMGQGLGAVASSVLSDRFGRKKIMVAAQMALLVFGMAAGFAPSFPVLAFLKFVIGGVQQGVVTSVVTFTIELYPAERRSAQSLIGGLLWGVCSSSLALFAYLFRNNTWRHLQIVLSAASAPIIILQWWLVDESIRWLMANGRVQEARRVVERAARMNRKDVNTVLQTLEAPVDEGQELNSVEKALQEVCESSPAASTDHHTTVIASDAKQKLSLLDLFRRKRLLYNSLVMWVAWFTCAFSFFALYLMSVRLQGDPILNYFLMSLMELVPVFIFYFLVDRVGRKWALRPFFMLTGVCLIGSGVFRMYNNIHALGVLSVVFAMLGMVGASGMFGAVFFYTPELFPTNIRNQALGMCSSAGRLGGMIAPFMSALADMAVWAPGVMIGTFCFVVICCMHILPETRGRELPNTVEDIERWVVTDKKKGGR